MKSSLHRLLAVLLALAMLFTLGATAFADEDEEPQSAPAEEIQSAPAPVPAPEPAPPVDSGTPVPDETVQTLVDPVTVELPFGSVTLDAGESIRVEAQVAGAGSGATYDWRSSSPGVVKVSGSGATANITAVAAGNAKITLTVTSRDKRTNHDYVNVTVAAAAKPVSVTGGAGVTIDEGEHKNLSAGVSGGSGSYEYYWETDGSGVVNIGDHMRTNAEVFGGRPGSGVVLLTVYDAEDPTNNATTTWNFTVKNNQQLVAPEAELSRGTVDLGTGATGSLSLRATGGSGSYDYFWHSDNPAAVSVSGNGATAEIRAASSVISGANRAEITAYVRDRQTGLTSNTVSCVVVVSGGSASYTCVEYAQVGAAMTLKDAAAKISDAFARNFGHGVNNTGGVKFSNPSNRVGSFCFQDGTIVKADSSYTFFDFQNMLFRGDAAGEFSTNYMISDGGDVITGSIRVTVSGGGTPVRGASMSKNTLSMPTYSSQALSVAVTPIDANYSVDWTTSDAKILTISGGGNAVTLTSGNNTGKVKITATVYDTAGTRTVCTCDVTVYSRVSPSRTSSVTFDTSLALTLGSDYYGTKLADSMTNKFRNAFNTYPSENDTITFPSLGNARFGTMRARDGSAVSTNRNYTFRDWIDMYFIPSAAGTYAMTYQFRHGNNTMSGNIKINIQAASMTVSMNPSVLRMSPYSNQNINLTVEPASAGYKVKWSSNNTRVATVSGSNATAVVNSHANGTATVTAVITDARGFEIQRSCTVLVTDEGSVFDPTVTTTLGIPYTGTGTSSAMRSQFAALYNTQLSDNATIRFTSSGNTDVAVMRLADGSMIRPNVNYTLAQYVAMYTQPVAKGTYSVPYTLTYGGKDLTGTVNVIVNAADVSTNLKPASDAAFGFSDPMNNSTAGTLFAESIRNTVGSGWSYVRFGSVVSGNGTLYADRNYTAINTNTNITPSVMTQLYFVPGALGGIYSAPYTVYNEGGAVVATGTLNVIRPGASGFTDVPANAYYAKAVNWSVDRGITSGTGVGTFSPNMIVTRGQAVTFLWRAAGQPKVTTVNPFADVAENAYYYDAVLWAVQQGITNGTGINTFSPDSRLNRDQLLTFLCRASGSYAEGDNWSQMAVNWANAHKLLEGVPGGFVAASACPRSDVVYYIWKSFNA